MSRGLAADDWVQPQFHNGMKSKREQKKKSNCKQIATFYLIAKEDEETAPADVTTLLQELLLFFKQPVEPDYSVWCILK
jgi:hypothetical protein